MAEASNPTEAKSPATAEAPSPAVKMSWDEFCALVKRAETGDQTCLPQIRKASKPAENAELSRWFHNSYRNPAEWLKDSLSEWVGGKDNLAVPEAVEGTMERLRKELEGPDPTPMERLLAERAVFCWFTVNTHETIYNRANDLTIRQAEFHLRRIDSAHKRFLSAVATLARVRKLALPALQVNIARNQVNVSRTEG